jgi:hypothetical protein
MEDCACPSSKFIISISWLALDQRKGRRMERDQDWSMLKEMIRELLAWHQQFQHRRILLPK